MSEFVKVEGLNKKGEDLLEAYKIYMAKELPEIVLAGTKQMLLTERSRAVCDAIRNEVTVEEFENVLRSYKAYMKGDAEFVGDAMVYVQENMGESNKYTIVRRGNSVVVQRRVGIRASEVAELFGVSPTKANSLVNNGFIETFVDTYMRKKVAAVVEKYSALLDGVKVKTSDVYKLDGRKVFDIDVDFYISPSSINSDTCEKLNRVLEAIEKEVVVV